MHILLDERAVRPDDLVPSQRRFLKIYRSWPRFHDGPRREPEPLLRALERYPDCVLVAGCQRSGTTMLTRLIARSRSFRPLALTHDDELDAALTLCGRLDLPQGSRYCFQTTYLNERFPEYRLLGPRQKLIWVIRNPHSVVYSMVYNWKRWALNELYESAREAALARVPALMSGRQWPFGPSSETKACVAYVGKSAQILDIRNLIPADQLMIVEYDEVVGKPAEWLPRIFEFAGERYDPAYAADVRSDSVRKAQRMSDRTRRRLEDLAMPTYHECLELRRATVVS